MSNTELIYDVIHAMKNNILWDDQSTLGVNLAGGVSSVPTTAPEFVPITGYDDSTAPFVLYSFISRTFDPERYYIYIETLRFYVYDTNIDRMWAISRAMKEYLNVGDDITNLKDHVPDDSRYRILSSNLVSSLSMPPIERDGFVSTVNEFRVQYVLL